jgi:hypothetical protein
MVVILIRWYIIKGMELDFISHWENVMTVPKGVGLYRETLCQANPEIEDVKFHTYDVESGKKTCVGLKKTGLCCLV